MSIEAPVLYHCESGRKALVESLDPPIMTYWARWSNIYVTVDSPLLDYKSGGDPGHPLYVSSATSGP